MDRTVDILSTIGIPVWIFDVDESRVIWGNKLALRHWNADTLEELRSRDMSTDMSESVRKRLRQYQLDCALENRTFLEDWTLYPNGVPCTSQLSFTGFDLPDGRKALLVQQLSELEESSSGTLHSMQALMHTSAMIWLYDEDLNLIYTNPAARSAAVTGSQCLADLIVRETELTRVLECLDKNRSCDLEIEVATCEGIRWHAMNLQNSPDPVSGNRTVLVSSTDITVRRQVEADAQIRARTDSLTKLPNRAALLEELGRRIERSRVQQSHFSLLFMDIDRFKLVNDSLGHTVGDSLLVEFARLVTEQVTDSDMVARLSGDEFVVLLAGSGDDQYAIDICDAIIKASGSPIMIEGHMLRIASSIGICRYPEHGESVTELMQHADIAMYSAKANGGGYLFFESAMGSSQLSRLSMESDLASALENDQLQLFYQPKIDVRNLNVAGMEALIRWMHPEKGMVNPLEFISVAEETGMIHEIGEWVLKQAMTDQVRWRDEEGMDISVAVNISPMQFGTSNFDARIEELIRETGINPDKLNLEVTESMLIADSDHVSNLLNSLSSHGIEISIDDFGTGFSNLANLQKYPVSCLKIDRAFVNSKQIALLEVILHMGKALGMEVVAEGVETLEQARWLQSHECDLLQGFYFSKPCPYDEIVEFVRTFDPENFHFGPLSKTEAQGVKAA